MMAPALDLVDFQLIRGANSIHLGMLIIPHHEQFNSQCPSPIDRIFCSVFLSTSTFLGDKLQKKMSKN